MPIYEYRCTDCGCKFEVFASMKAKEKGLTAACPTCGSTRAVAVLSAVAIGVGGKPRAPSCCSGPGCCGGSR